MKTDLNKQTKYFKNVFNHKTLKFELVEIPLNKENWFYVQLDGSVRYAFLKYHCPLPKYIIIEDLSHEMTINIFRETIKNVKDLLWWKEYWVCILEELNHQAKLNSVDKEDDDINYIKYKFKLL